jgi:hypothetical protein
MDGNGRCAVLAFAIILMMSCNVTSCYCIVLTSWNSGSNLVLWKLHKDQRAFPRAIRPVNLPGQSGMGGQTSEDGGFSFVYFIRISWIYHDLMSFPGKATCRGRLGEFSGVWRDACYENWNSTICKFDHMLV